MIEKVDSFQTSVGYIIIIANTNFELFPTIDIRINTGGPICISVHHRVIKNRKCMETSVIFNTCACGQEMSDLIADNDPLLEEKLFQYIDRVLEAMSSRPSSVKRACQ